MSYSDQSRRSSPASIAAVVGVHLAIGYAIVSGLAYNAVRHIPIITAVNYPDDPQPPPPRTQPVERTKLPNPVTTPLAKAQDDQLKTPEIIVALPSVGDFGSPTGGGASEPQPLPPTRPSLAHDAVPGTDRLRWITTDDYPAAALRQGVTGTVVIAAMIGTDGKVRSCEVTRSSGSPLLDDTTCRLYAKRGHFTAALDADGNPVAALRSDRFRWQIPN